ncbi:thiol-disulfide oxidoreductase DCC family protein [Roseovarius sp. C7]|uniref:thiol-disulfide oxidoreductase DCC family protein n=1 Tax=Roseovarius sp. C7 TaxID=3398643 RepID=UPI0039F69993
MPARLTVMDAQCALCARGARWIARHDRREEFRILPIQTPLGEALLRHYGMDPQDPASWLYIENGRAYSSLDAIIRVGQRFGGLWRGLAVLRLLPRPVQDWLYARIARNRYRVMGRTDMCALPDPALRKRLIA